MSSNHSTLGKELDEFFVNKPGKREFYAVYAPIIASFIDCKQNAIAAGHHDTRHPTNYADDCGSSKSYSFQSSLDVFRSQGPSIYGFNPLPDFARAVKYSLWRDWHGTFASSSFMKKELPHPAFAPAREMYESSREELWKAYCAHSPGNEDLNPIHFGIPGLNSATGSIVGGLWSHDAAFSERLMRLFGHVHLRGVDHLMGASGLGFLWGIGMIGFYLSRYVEKPRESLERHGFGRSVGCPFLRSRSADGVRSTAVLTKIVETAFERDVVPRLHDCQTILENRLVESANERVRAAIEGRSWTKPSQCPVARLKAVVTGRAQ